MIQLMKIKRKICLADFNTKLQMQNKVMAQSCLKISTDQIPCASTLLLGVVLNVDAPGWNLHFLRALCLWNFEILAHLGREHWCLQQLWFCLCLSISCVLKPKHPTIGANIPWTLSCHHCHFHCIDHHHECFDRHQQSSVEDEDLSPWVTTSLEHFLEAATQRISALGATSRSPQ